MSMLSFGTTVDTKPRRSRTEYFGPFEHPNVYHSTPQPSTLTVLNTVLTRSLRPRIDNEEIPRANVRVEKRGEGVEPPAIEHTFQRPNYQGCAFCAHTPSGKQKAESGQGRGRARGRHSPISHRQRRRET